MKTVAAVVLVFCCGMVRAQTHTPDGQPLSRASIRYYQNQESYPLLHFPRYHTFRSSSTGNDTTVVLLGLAERFSSPYPTTYLDSLAVVYSLPKFVDVPGNDIALLVMGSRLNATGTGVYADKSNILYRTDLHPSVSDIGNGRTVKFSVPHVHMDSAFFVALVIADTNKSDIEFGIAIDSANSSAPLPFDDDLYRTREVAKDTQFYVAGTVFHDLSDTIHWYSNAHFIAYVTDAQSGVGEISPNGSSVRVYPNPSAQSAIFDYYVPSSGLVAIEVFDDAGSRVRRENLGAEPVGPHSFTMHTNDLPAGHYLYRILIGNQYLSGTLQIVH